MAVATVPGVSISLGGERLGTQDLDHVVEVLVRQSLSLPALCELRFVDPTEELAGRAADALGSELRLSLSDRSPALFSGEVTAAEFEFGPDAGRILHVRAYDLLHRLRKRRPLRTHSEITAMALAEELTGDLGLEVDARASGPRWRRIFQCRQSDYHLLRDVAERSGLYFVVRDGTLVFMTLEGDGREEALHLGTSLLEARAEINTDAGCRTVSAAAWSPLGAEPRAGEAAEARSGRDVAVDAPASAAGGSDERTLVDVTVEDDEQAEAVAQAALDRLAATEVVLRGTAEGDARLTPGVSIDVEGLGDHLSGTYTLTWVEHCIDERQGYVCRFSSEPPAPVERDHTSVATLGEVTAVDDPNRLGRVRVSLPAFGDLETGWLEVVASGGGRGKGLVTVPDVGDRVLLLCPRGDPGNGIVVGGMYGEAGAPDETVGADGVRRFSLLTPGGQWVRLDDEARTLTLSDVTGSTLELGPESVVLKAKVPLVLEAPGQAVKVRGASIDFEQA